MRSIGEIERVLAAHPAVSDAAVIGVPDAGASHRVIGFIQLASGVTGVTVGEILADIAPRLAGYRLPESLSIVGEIPRDRRGDIDHRPLLRRIATLAA